VRDVDDFLDDVDDLLDEDDDWEWGTDAARWSPATAADDSPWESRSAEELWAIWQANSVPDATYAELMQRSMMPIADAYRQMAAMYGHALDGLMERHYAGRFEAIEWREPDVPTQVERQRTLERIRAHLQPDYLVFDETHLWLDHDLRERSRAVAAEIAEQHAASPARIVSISTAEVRHG